MDQTIEEDAIDSMFCTLRMIRANGCGDWDVLTSFLANLLLGTERPFETNDHLRDTVAMKMRMINQ